MRAANDIYDVPEGRPFLVRLPVRLGLTLLAGVLLVASAVMVVFTGAAARNIGSALGLGSSVAQIWDIAKWPVLLIIVSLLFAVMYWAAPNAKVGRFRWITAGGLVAVAIWLIASAGFAFYVANFGSYNKVYGTLASVIVFLIWLWISNIAVLLGAVLDAQLIRERAIAAGADPDADHFVEPARHPQAAQPRLAWDQREAHLAYGVVAVGVDQADRLPGAERDPAVETGSVAYGATNAGST